MDILNESNESDAYRAAYAFVLGICLTYGFSIGKPCHKSRDPDVFTFQPKKINKREPGSCAKQFEKHLKDLLSHTRLNDTISVEINNVAGSPNKEVQITALQYCGN